MLLPSPRPKASHPNSFVGEARPFRLVSTQPPPSPLNATSRQQRLRTKPPARRLTTQINVAPRYARERENHQPAHAKGANPFNPVFRHLKANFRTFAAFFLDLHRQFPINLIPGYRSPKILDRVSDFPSVFKMFSSGKRSYLGIKWSNAATRTAGTH